MSIIEKIEGILEQEKIELTDEKLNRIERIESIFESTAPVDLSKVKEKVKSVFEKHVGFPVTWTNVTTAREDTFITLIGKFSISGSELISGGTVSATATKGNNGRWDGNMSIKFFPSGRWKTNSLDDSHIYKTVGVVY